MADWRSYFAGRYLSGPELTEDRTLTIAKVDRTLVEDPDGGAARERMTITWRENGQKPWLPCKTTGACVAAMHGDDADADWPGKRVTLFFDPTVKVGSKKVGGIRVRGAPGIRPMTIEISMPRKRPLKVDLIDTAPRQQRNSPAPDLATVLADAGLTEADVDRWLLQQGKPTLANGNHEKLPGWLAADPRRLEQIRALIPDPGPQREGWGEE